mmetsp:Transcript_662/g.2116  ORF Transcript_662/g.2116 Transcript_662/m.2116 type:complete len:292 (+) Transcript_662:3-878(+)
MVRRRAHGVAWRGLAHLQTLVGGRLARTSLGKAHGCNVCPTQGVRRPASARPRRGTPPIHIAPPVCKFQVLQALGKGREEAGEAAAVHLCDALSEHRNKGKLCEALPLSVRRGPTALGSAKAFAEVPEVGRPYGARTYAAGRSKHVEDAASVMPRDVGLGVVVGCRCCPRPHSITSMCGRCFRELLALLLQLACLQPEAPHLGSHATLVLRHLRTQLLAFALDAGEPLRLQVFDPKPSTPAHTLGLGGKQGRLLRELRAERPLLHFKAACIGRLGRELCDLHLKCGVALLQ